jgi:hypothetical protein
MNIYLTEILQDEAIIYYYNCKNDALDMTRDAMQDEHPDKFYVITQTDIDNNRISVYGITKDEMKLRIATKITELKRGVSSLEAIMNSI